MDRKSAIWMAKNDKDSIHTRHISRRIHLVRNGKEWNLNKEVWCEEGLQLADIGNKNVRDYQLNPILGYSMVRLENGQNTCQRGVPGYRIVWRKCVINDSTGLNWRLDSTNLRFSDEFIMMNLSLEGQRYH